MNKGRRLLTKRPWITALVVVVIAGGLAGGMWWFSDRNANATTAASGPVNRLIAASVGTIKKSITTTGTLTPAHQEQVNFAATGTVTAVDVTAGQTVTAGQALATVDTLQMRATVAADRATLAADQAKLVSDQNASAADTQIAADQSSIAVAQSDVNDAQTAVDSATLASPIAGIVASVNLTVGQHVSASTVSTASTSASASSATGSAGSGSGGTAGTGSSGGGSGGPSGTGSGGGGSGSSSPSTAQFLIVSTSSWLATVTVDDSQVGLLTVGDQSELTVSDSTGTPHAAQPIFGTVQSVGLISTSTTATAAYPVVVQVTGSPGGLHDGTAVNVTLIYKQVANVLTVPSTAVHTVNGQQVVYVMPADSAAAENAANPASAASGPTAAAGPPDAAGAQTGGAAGGFAARAAAASVDVSAASTTVVTVGDTDATNTEITHGLSEGDLVVVTTTVGAGRTGSGLGAGTGGRLGPGTGGNGGFGGAGGAGAFGGGAGRVPGGN